MRRLEKIKIHIPSTSSTISSITAIDPSTFITTHYNGTINKFVQTSSYLDTYHKHITSYSVDLPLLCSTYTKDFYSLKESLFLGTPISLLLLDLNQQNQQREILDVGIFQILKYNETILICLGFDSKIRFFDVKNVDSVSLIKTIDMPSKPCCMDVDAGSNLLAVACIDKFVYTFDLVKDFAKKKYSLRLDYPVVSVKFRKPYELLVGGVEGRIELLKLADDNSNPYRGYGGYNSNSFSSGVSNTEKSFAFKAHRSFQEAHAVSFLEMQGDLLISGGSDGKIILQNVKERSKLATCSFGYSITSMVWDGERVLVASGENFSKGVYSDDAELHVVDCSARSFY